MFFCLDIDLSVYCESDCYGVMLLFIGKLIPCQWGFGQLARPIKQFETLLSFPPLFPLNAVFNNKRVNLKRLSFAAALTRLTCFLSSSYILGSSIYFIAGQCY